jgi:putative transcriptional regulator
VSAVPAKGRLLVATPPLVDPNFDRTVVLLLEHGVEGSVGIVLNRPTDATVAEAVPGWEALAAAPGVLFIGGPVSTEAAIALGTAVSPAAEGWSPVLDEVGTVDLHRRPEDLAGTIDSVRVFAGYAGWGPGQLEAELEADAWLVVPAEPDDVLGDQPNDLWRRVLRRQGGRLAWLANAPADPSVN